MTSRWTNTWPLAWQLSTCATLGLRNSLHRPSNTNRHRRGTIKTYLFNLIIWDACFVFIVPLIGRRLIGDGRAFVVIKLSSGVNGGISASRRQCRLDFWITGPSQPPIICPNSWIVTIDVKRCLKLQNAADLYRISNISMFSGFSGGWTIRIISKYTCLANRNSMAGAEAAKGSLCADAEHPAWPGRVVGGNSAAMSDWCWICCGSICHPIGTGIFRPTAVWHSDCFTTCQMSPTFAQIPTWNV